jgi:NAD(P)-dependent dehydrogenase (short-subunit alcohol dehydrogenase family)
MGKLQGKTALITGGSSGIGSPVSENLCSRKLVNKGNPPISHPAH